MAEFVRAQIFGTTFEITSRYSDLQPVGMGAVGLVCRQGFPRHDVVKRRPVPKKHDGKWTIMLEDVN